MNYANIFTKMFPERNFCKVKMFPERNFYTTEMFLVRNFLRVLQDEAGDSRKSPANV